MLLAALFLLTASGLCTAGAASGPQSERGTISAVKTVPSVSPSNKVTIVLTITNNGSLPVTGIEIYEYFNPTFTLSGDVTITQPNGTSVLTLAQSNTVTQVQAIIDPPPPDSLRPKESMTLRYMEVAAGPGDFQVPPALVWFTYNVGSTETKASLYSNGIVVHIANATEKLVALIFPYVMAGTTFTATMLILMWSRRQLAMLERKKLSR